MKLGHEQPTVSCHYIPEVCTNNSRLLNIFSGGA